MILKEFLSEYEEDACSTEETFFSKSEANALELLNSEYSLSLDEMFLRN